MGMLGVGLVVLLALALAAVYAMVRAGPDRHWRLVPGALAPLVVQLAVFGIWMSLTATEGYTALGVLALGLFSIPPTLVANVFMSLRHRALTTPRLLTEGMLMALVVPPLIWGVLVGMREVIGVGH